MSDEVKVRLAVPSDAPILAEFNTIMAKETEGVELDRGTLAGGLAALFEKPQYGFYVVAEVSGQIAGGLMITYEWTDWRNGVIWWVQSVYVRPAYRRRGIYTRLYSFVKELAAREGNVRGFRLYVEKENFVAQKTYQAAGMIEARYKVFEEMPPRV